MGHLGESFPQMILDRVSATPEREAFRAPKADDSGWFSLTWQQTYDDTEKIAAGLLALGLEPEQRVSIASDTSLDWILADYGIMLAGGATTTIYASTGDVDVAYILSDSNTRFVFAADESQVEKIALHRDELPNLTKVILFSGTPDGDWTISMDDLRAMGEQYLKEHPESVKEHARAVRSDNLSTLIYTSGTTGRPKGVELTQSNWTYEGAFVEAVGLLTIDDVQFLWLPLAHSFGKLLLSLQLQVGFVTAVDGRVPKIVENLPIVRPTFMAAVPRIFEKVYAKVGQTANEPGAKGKIFQWAFRVGTEAAEKELAGEKVGGMLAVKRNIADKLVFSKIREALGGQMRYMISGSAALNKDIAMWFYTAGLIILEGYGLTETSAGTCVMRPDRIKFGTVGEPAPGSEIMIADDGEILIRGGGVMRGYRNLPEANAEVFAAGEGWFATGDIGEIDDMGRVKITDRKKDLVKTSGGKYIAPSAIEGQFKAISGIVGNIVIHANERNFVSALITLDPDAAAAWAAEHGKAGASMSDITKDPELLKELQASVDELNTRLNKWETIKKFEVLDRDFSVEEGELTPSLKVKRKAVEEKYRDILDAMYTS